MGAHEDMLLTLVTTAGDKIFKDFPPRQKPGTSYLDGVMETVTGSSKQ